MSEPVKMKLHAVYFPSISVAANAPGYPSMISSWLAEKHSLIRCEERQNGDVWLHHPNGSRSEISALVIAYRVRLPDVAVKK